MPKLLLPGHGDEGDLHISLAADFASTMLPATLLKEQQEGAKDARDCYGRGRCLGKLKLYPSRPCLYSAELAALHALQERQPTAMHDSLSMQTLAYVQPCAQTVRLYVTKCLSRAVCWQSRSASTFAGAAMQKWPGRMQARWSRLLISSTGKRRRTSSH